MSDFPIPAITGAEPENRPAEARVGNRFAPGRSGNPGGRPKALQAVLDAAREHTEAAILTLAEICTDPDKPSAARVAAAQALLDRGWGKPTTGPGGDDGEQVSRLVIERRIVDPRQTPEGQE
jgi:hypothetical protein